MNNNQSRASSRESLGDSLAPESWHQFSASTEAWAPVQQCSPSRQVPGVGRNLDPDLTVVSWNIHSGGNFAEERAEAILSRILGLQKIDIIFFQEVSKPALVHLLEDPRIRQSWYSSEKDLTSWGGHLFATMTLLSKDRFTSSNLGSQWRVKLPSRFDRDALCCDIFVPSLSDGIQLRLINVHLDSLPALPSKRPEQLSIVANLLREAGHGLVAGDFNAVLPQDDKLIRNNRLVDAWVELHEHDSGFTWGVDGKQRFSAGRLDRVAIFGLRAIDIKVLHPDTITGHDGCVVPWSDHSGLKFTFGFQ
ncbi:hypothetical protein FGRMN_1473 [Fusarium graminum]|nr:hypothetical protein FGRMN_1473 [Fusarium graminum]